MRARALAAADDGSGTIAHDEAERLIALMYPSIPHKQRSKAMKLVGAGEIPIDDFERVVMAWREMAEHSGRADEWARAPHAKARGGGGVQLEHVHVGGRVGAPDVASVSSTAAPAATRYGAAADAFGGV